MSDCVMSVICTQVPSTSSQDSHEQLTVLVRVVRETDALREYRTRLGLTSVQVDEGDEIELVGSTIDHMKSLHSTRTMVREQIEEEKVMR